MSKSLLIVLATFAAIGFTGCEEEEATLRFATEQISDTNNVRIDYYSPDPCCVSKMYWIVANGNESSVTMRCTNADAIYLSNSLGGNESTFVSSSGDWTAQRVSPNTITLTFNETADLDFDEPYSYEFINIGANTKKGPVSESISVTRILDSKQPLSGR